MLAHPHQVGVESAHSFGDILFNVPLIKAIGEHYDTKPYVAIRSPYKDALYNIPWVGKIIEINNMREGAAKLQQAGCTDCFQITQNIKFFEFKEHNPEHSLIDTPLCVGRQLGIKDFDQRPIFIPTAYEIATTDSMVSKSTIGIESVFKSGQSWATTAAIHAIIKKYHDTHRILWLSNEGAPQLASVDNLLRFTRRQAIMCLRACDIFFSVGSGFFCASQALPTMWQPKTIVCLWTDNLYKYEHRLAQLAWHPNIQWIHNQDELAICLRNL